MLKSRTYPTLLPSPQDVGIFTKKEMEILKRTYLPDKLIADELNISYFTVTTHTQNMRRKSGFRNKGEMVRFATKKGYIE